MFRKKDTETPTRRHFSAIHSKVQDKYEQMQKRLEKSKSLDSLAMLNDDFVFVEARKESDNIYVEQLVISEEKKPSISIDTVVENIQYSDTISLQEVTEVNIDTPTETDRAIEKFFNYPKDNFLSTSFESLNESTEYEESLPPLSPKPKSSIRNRIGSRISAAKEKRRDKKKESLEKVEKLVLSNSNRQEVNKVSKKTKLGTITIALIEATGLETETADEKPRLLFCRFRLGSEKFKSKLVKSNVSPVKWQELFNIHLYEESMLEISLFDKDIFLGRSTIDLSETEREKTHKMHLDLEGCAANVKLFILLTISGINYVDNIVWDFEEYNMQNQSARRQLAWYQLRDDYTDVGCMSIFVYGAKGLSANDCYCVLELNNDRLQTHSDYKTQNPNWMKIFTFTVTDITSLLEVTIFEEKKSEAVGRVTIPLIKINNGQKKWYALKDATQRERAKGNNPRILLEMRILWNLARASIRVINPKEQKLLELSDKLDRHIFAKNLSRAKAVCSWILDAFKVIKTCFEWESRKWNVIALTAWLVMCSIFRVWMLPLLLLVPFAWYRPENYFLFYWRKYLQHDETDIVKDLKSDKEEKTSLRQKLNTLQEMVQVVQNFIGQFASYGESVKNLFNFTVPFLSCLTIAIAVVISLVMFLIPVKFIFMFWGIHKFTRKILRPNRVANNEILDLLSRVPDDEILLDCQELPLEKTTDDDV